MICVSKFKRENQLAAHYMIVHEGARLKCNQCDFYAERKFYMNKHIQSNHNPEKMKDEFNNQEIKIETDDVKFAL